MNTTKKEFMDALYTDTRGFTDNAMETIYAMLKERGDIGIRSLESLVSEVSMNYAQCADLEACNEVLEENFNTEEELEEYYNFFKVDNTYIIHP